MKLPVPIVVVLGVLAFASNSAYAGESDSHPGAQLLGRVGANQYKVYWSCPKDACRVLIDRPPTPVIPALPSSSEKRAIPVNQAWVLRSDGTSIAQLYGLPSGVQDRYVFVFPQSAKAEAFAVVLKFGDHISTWWLAQDETAK